MIQTDSYWHNLKDVFKNIENRFESESYIKEQNKRISD